jgi:uncharacterized membrane protein YhaH (DUF805 family)
LLEAFFLVLKKYKDFSGRSGRREFWMFFFVNLIVGLVFSILGMIPFFGKLFFIASVLYFLAILVPSIALGIRRLHDTDKTGYLILLCIIPVAGAIILLYLCYLEGTPGENQYGPEPKSEDEVL